MRDSFASTYGQSAESLLQSMNSQEEELEDTEKLKKYISRQIQILSPARVEDIQAHVLSEVRTRLANTQGQHKKSSMYQTGPSGARKGAQTGIRNTQAQQKAVNTGPTNIPISALGGQHTGSSPAIRTVAVGSGSQGLQVGGQSSTNLQWRENRQQQNGSHQAAYPFYLYTPCINPTHRNYRAISLQGKAEWEIPCAQCLIGHFERQALLEQAEMQSKRTRELYLSPRSLLNSNSHLQLPSYSYSPLTDHYYTSHRDLIGNYYPSTSNYSDPTYHSHYYHSSGMINLDYTSLANRYPDLASRYSGLLHSPTFGFDSLYKY